jgi:hypothetical protein
MEVILLLTGLYLVHIGWLRGRAFASGAVGRGFDSPAGHHQGLKSLVAFALPPNARLYGV